MELSVDTWLLFSRETEAVFVGMVFSIIQITDWWHITSLETIWFGMFSFAVVATSSLEYCCMCLNFLNPITSKSLVHVYIGVGPEENARSRPILATRSKNRHSHRDNSGVDDFNALCYWWLSLTEKMFIFHNSKTTFPELYPEKDMKVPDRFLMVLDMEQGTLGFIVDGNYLGAAHGALGGRRVCPMICYKGNVDCNIKMEYIGHSINPVSLKKLCRKSVRHIFTEGGSLKGNIELLNIPNTVKTYITENV